MYPKRYQVWALTLLLAVSVAACASLTVTKSTETLDAIGQSFLASAKQIDEAYRAKLVTEAEYQKWRQFVPGFKLAFAQAAQSLETVRAAGETTTPEQTATLILQLKNQLLQAVLQTYAPAVKGGQ